MKKTRRYPSDSISSVLSPWYGRHDCVRDSVAASAAVRVASSIGSVFGEDGGLIRVGRPFSAAYRTFWSLSNQLQALDALYSSWSRDGKGWHGKMDDVKNFWRIGS